MDIARSCRSPPKRLSSAMALAAHLNHTKTVYVASLDAQVTRDILYGAFVPFGDIVECVRCRGSAWTRVEFAASHVARSQLLDTNTLAGFIEFEVGTSCPRLADRLANRTRRRTWTTARRPLRI